MNCHATQAVLDLHAEGRLTPRRAKSVAAHLASCPDCRAAIAPAPTPVKAATGDFKTLLAASLKAQPKSAPASAPKLELWPRDFSGVASAAAGLLLIAAAIGWSGVPSQREPGGDELAAGRIP